MAQTLLPWIGAYGSLALAAVGEEVSRLGAARVVPAEFIPGVANLISAGWPATGRRRW